jgi:hypothetical protein
LRPPNRPAEGAQIAGSEPARNLRAVFVIGVAELTVEHALLDGDGEPIHPDAEAEDGRHQPNTPEEDRPPAQHGCAAQIHGVSGMGVGAAPHEITRDQGDVCQFRSRAVVAGWPT